jgi:hypothetical protein
VSKKGDPITSPPKPLPLHFCLDVWQQEEMGENRVKALPWSIWLNTLKRDLMETMELS